MKNKLKAILCLLMASVLVLPVIPVALAARETDIALNSYIPMNLKITMNQEKYGSLGMAKIRISVANMGTEGIENLRLENVMPETLMVFGLGDLKTETAVLAPGESLTVSFEACLNPAKVKLNFFTKLFLNIKIGFKKAGYSDEGAGTGKPVYTPGEFDALYEADNSLQFGKTTVNQKIRVTCSVNNAGFVQSSVKDAVTGAKIAGAEVTAYQTSAALAASGKVTRTATDANGDFRFTLPAGTYNMTVTKAGYVSVIRYAVTVAKKNTVSLPSFIMVPGSISTSGQAGGTVRNALTNSPVSGVSLKFRPGWNNKTGSVVINSGGTALTVSTNASGVYYGTLPLGNYTAELTKTGFSKTYFNLYASSGGDACLNQNITIAPS